LTTLKSQKNLLCLAWAADKKKVRGSGPRLSYFQ
jgi:hypothetical protein